MTVTLQKQVIAMRKNLLTYGALFVASLSLTLLARHLTTPSAAGGAPVAAPTQSAPLSAVQSVVSHWTSTAPPQSQPPKPKSVPPPGAALPTIEEMARQNVIDEQNRVEARIRSLRIQLENTENAAERPAVVRALFNLVLSSGDPRGEIRELIRMATMDGDEGAAAAAKQIYDQLPPLPTPK